MSKPVKELIRKELVRRFQDLTSLAIVDFAGIDAITTHRIRGRLREKDIRLTVVKNSIARQAFDVIGLKGARDLFDGPCAVAFGTDPERVHLVAVVRELLDIGKATPNLTVKAALLDGEVFRADRIRELSEYPTRQEASSRLVSRFLAPGARLASCLIGPGATIAAIVKVIDEKKQQQGDSGPEGAD